MIAAYIFFGVLFGVPILLVCCLPFMARAEAKVRVAFRQHDTALRQSHSWDELIYFDKKAGSAHIPRKIFGVCALDGVLVFGSLDNPTVISTDEVLSFQPHIQGTQVVTGGTSAIAVHGIGIGSVNLSARRMVKSIALRLVVADPRRPLVDIVFFSTSGRGAPATGLRVRAATRRLDHMQALLQIALIPNPAD